MRIREVIEAGSLTGLLTAFHCYCCQQAAKKLYGYHSFPDIAVRAEERKQQAQWLIRPKFSFLVPLYNTPFRYLKEMMKSISDQTYMNWELCLADASDNSLYDDIVKICNAFSIPKENIRYRKIENRGISDNTNVCIDLAEGDYIVLLDHDDVLHPEILYKYAVKIIEDKADYLYCDEATFQNDNIDDLITVHLKPNYAPDNLLANNYICHMSCIKRSLLDEEPEIRFRRAFDGSQDHDLILRAVMRAKCIVHVPGVYYYWRAHEGSTASELDEKKYAIAAGKKAVEEALRTSGETCCRVESTRAAANIFRVIRSCRETPNIEIIRTGKRLAENLNQEAQDSKAAFLLFLGSGLCLEEGAKEELASIAARKNVGAVCGLIQHHGTIEGAAALLGTGKYGLADAYYRGYPARGVGYMGRLCYPQDVSAGFASFLMIRKELFLSVGGFHKDYRVSLFDIDICLRLRKEGYLCVFTPYAIADGRWKPAFSDTDCDTFIKIWGIPLSDPYSNPGFSDCCLSFRVQR